MVIFELCITNLTQAIQPVLNLCLTFLFVQAAVSKVMSIHSHESTKKGDILLFLPGKEEVETACSLIHKYNEDGDLVSLVK